MLPSIQRIAQPSLKRPIHWEKLSSFGNIKLAKLVADMVWKFMDDGNDRSWDWEGIMEEMLGFKAGLLRT